MTTTEQPRVGERRPGGRASRVRSAVLDATVEVLEEVGYDATTYDEIASRAGVHKTTIYRRWPSKPELVADALDLHSAEHIPIPDTGTLSGDLTALARSVAANISSVGGARRSMSIVAAAAHSEELAGTVRTFMSRRVSMAEPVVARAAERGEIASNTDARAVIEAVVGPIWFRFLFTGEPIDDPFIATLVGTVVRGAQAEC